MIESTWADVPAAKEDTLLKRMKRILLILTALVLLAGACSCRKGPAAKKYSDPKDFEGPAHEVAVTFVNVGKADCAIVSVDGHFWLVDTGTEESFVNTFAALRLMGAESIDGVILTHGHSDHMGGLAPISEGYRIGRVVYPALLMDGGKVASLLSDLGLAGETVSFGDGIEIADGVSFDVLGPITMNSEDDNDNSLVVRLTVNGRTFLFTGDMQLAEDGELVRSGADLSCDVLKVPNHGNPDATSEAFAKAAEPLLSVTSTDTSVDSNSANRRVLAKLGTSENLITENYEIGVLMTVSQRGEICVASPERPKPAETKLEVTEAYKARQSVTIENGGEAVDLSGWFIYSTKGCEVFVFPEGTTVEAGCAIRIACLKSPDAGTADLIWNKKKIWAGSKEDWAVLCDPYGNEISRLVSR